MIVRRHLFGILVSTTHTVTGSIIGVGAARKVSAVRWNIAANIVIAWIVTLPAPGLMAARRHVVVRFFSDQPRGLFGRMSRPAATPAARPLGRRRRRSGGSVDRSRPMPRHIARAHRVTFFSRSLSEFS